MNADAAAQLETILHSNIPLAQAMGVRVADYDGERLLLEAPLAPNINHKETAFGGSLSALTVLCGWGLLQLKLEEAGLHKHIVIQESSIRYLRPVAETLRAQCVVPQDALDRLLRTLHRRDRARIELQVTIPRDGEPAVEFSGRYVVHG